MKVVPDDGEPFTITIGTRSIYLMEKLFPREAGPIVTAYRSAWAECKRSRIDVPEFDEFAETCELEFLQVSEEESEVDPTGAGPSPAP